MVFIYLNLSITRYNTCTIIYIIYQKTMAMHYGVCTPYVCTYAERVERTPILKPFSDYVGSIPETMEAEAFHLAYELKNLRHLTWRMAADFVFTNFRKTHRLYSSSLLLAEASQLRCELDNIVCHHFKDCLIQIDQLQRSLYCLQPSCFVLGS